MTVYFELLFFWHVDSWEKMARRWTREQMKRESYQIFGKYSIHGVHTKQARFSNNNFFWQTFKGHIVQQLDASNFFPMLLAWFNDLIYNVRGFFWQTIRGNIVHQPETSNFFFISNALLAWFNDLLCHVLGFEHNGLKHKGNLVCDIWTY